MGELKGLTDEEVIQKIKKSKKYEELSGNLQIQGRLSSTGNELIKESLCLDNYGVQNGVQIQKVFPTSFVIYNQYYGAVCEFDMYEDIADEVIDRVYVTRTKNETMPFKIDDVENKFVKVEEN
ncbi:hypothetical protein FACS1894193_04730 [Bacilli bacterium]|nr:hypothetical protein FACS1894192_07700 [Bacilli bacterium]GHU41228.1 hypothetical protein FACS1894193_04730 [Bacilli bacterium]